MSPALKTAKLVAVKLTMEQPEDCCGRTGESHQYLYVETQDGGGGPYIVIQTDRWAMDAEHIDAFAARLKEVLRSIESGQ